MSDGFTPGAAREYADRLGLRIDDADAERIAASAAGKDDVLDELESIPLASPPDREYREPEAGDDDLGAFLVRCDVGGREDGPLSGVRVAVKDNVAVAGVPMTAGSPLLSGYVPPTDATVVERLLDAGARVVGKTNLPEFASGGDARNYRFALARNPHDPERQPGDSSAGSAIAVATDEADVALGSDTGGSIRFPAAYSGLVGIKPTRGLVSHHGFVQYAKTLDTVGVLSRTVADAARTFSAVAGEDPRDERTLHARTGPYVESAAAGRDGLGGRGGHDALDGHDAIDGPPTIGLPASFFGRAPELDAVTRAALERLEDAGAELREVSIEHEALAIPAWLAIATAELGAYLRARGSNYWLLSAPDPALADALASGFAERSGALGDAIADAMVYAAYLEDGRGGVHYPRAGRARALVAEGVDGALADVDLLASTTIPMVAPRWDEETAATFENVRNTAPFNLTGHPALSVPCGTVDGLPVGLQLVGPRFAEARLFAAGAWWEAIHDDG